MIKCDKERFECKGEAYLCEAEFELIFMNYFEVLIKNRGLEQACNKYSNILERYEKALDIYKNQSNKKDFRHAYTDVVINEHEGILDDLLDDLIDYFEKKKRERND